MTSTGNIRKFKSATHALTHIGNTLLQQGKRCLNKNKMCILYDPQTQHVCAIGAMLTKKGRLHYALRGGLDTEDLHEVERQLYGLGVGAVQRELHDNLKSFRWFTSVFNKFAEKHRINLSIQ